MLFLRSLLHTLWMVITVIPYTLGVLLARVLGLHHFAGIPKTSH